MTEFHDPKTGKVVSVFEIPHTDMVEFVVDGVVLFTVQRCDIEEGFEIEPEEEDCDRCAEWERWYGGAPGD